MKKWLCVMISLCLVICLLAGCGSGEPSRTSDQLRIVVTVYPEYDWLRQILGDRMQETEMTMLLDSGVDLHSYQPTADDLVKISTCDLFVYIGGMSDAWVEDALRTAANPNRVTINLMETLDSRVREEEVVEGMQAEEEETDEEEIEYDEHVWLSLQNAVIVCDALADALAKLDADHAQTYKDNANQYIAELKDLDAQYAQAVDNASVRTLLFGDRFPFRYLVEDYGLDYYAAFVGCSAETEASFDTIVFLADKVDELGLHAILQIESSKGEIARTIRENTKAKDQQILTMNSLQSASTADGETDYLTVMTENLAVLRQALA